MDEEFDYGGPSQTPYARNQPPSHHQPVERVPLQSSVSADPTRHYSAYSSVQRPFEAQQLPGVLNDNIPFQHYQTVASQYGHSHSLPPSIPRPPNHNASTPSHHYNHAVTHRYPKYHPVPNASTAMSLLPLHPPKVHLEPIFLNETQIAPENLDPPLLRSPLFVSDVSVLLCPLLIDAIDTGLPKDAWEWESMEVLVPAAPKHELPRFTSMEKDQLDRVEAHLVKSTTGRGHIAWELYSTEMNYVRVLDIILNVCRKRLLDEHILEKISAKHIFDGFDDLYLLHLKLLSKMDQLFSVGFWDENVSRNDDLVKCYSKFIDAYSLSKKEIKNAEKYNADYNRFVDEMSRLAETGKKDLKNLMFSPIHRATRYPMLVKALLKKTPEGHPDKSDLQTALATVQELARQVNEKKEIEEGRTGIFDAFEQTKNCPPTFISSSRRMIESRDVVDTKNGKGYHLFLCNDLLMLTSNVKSSGVLGNIIGRGADVDKPHKYVALVPLTDVQVEEIPEGKDVLRIKFNTAGDRIKDSLPGSSFVFRFEGFDAPKFRNEFCAKYRNAAAVLSQTPKSKASSTSSSANTSNVDLHQVSSPPTSPSTAL